MPQQPKPVLARPERPAKPERPAPPPKPQRPRAPLETMRVAPDPIDDSLNPGDIEGDAAMEMSQLEGGFRARMAAEAARREGATQSGYYAVLVLETEDQMSALLKGLGVRAEDGDLYIDGRVIAEKFGIALPPSGLKLKAGGKVDPRLAKLVR